MNFITIEVRKSSVVRDEGDHTYIGEIKGFKALMWFRTQQGNNNSI